MPVRQRAPLSASHLTLRVGLLSFDYGHPGHRLVTPAVYAALVPCYAMNIRLLRNRDRALFLPAHCTVLDCSFALQQWLGPPEHEDVTELADDTPMVGISPRTLLAELRQFGFCALDLRGIVREFDTVEISVATAGLVVTNER